MIVSPPFSLGQEREGIPFGLCLSEVPKLPPSSPGQAKLAFGGFGELPVQLLFAPEQGRAPGPCSVHPRVGFHSEINQDHYFHPLVLHMKQSFKERQQKPCLEKCL